MLMLSNYVVSLYLHEIYTVATYVMTTLNQVLGKSSAKFRGLAKISQGMVAIFKKILRYKIITF